MVKTSLQSFQFWKLNLILSTSIQYHSAIHSIPTQFRINLIPFYWVPPLPGTRLPDQSTSWPEPPSWRSSPWCTCPRRPTASRSPRTSCLRRVSGVWQCSDAVTICLQSRPVDPDVVCQLVRYDWPYGIFIYNSTLTTDCLTKGHSSKDNRIGRENLTFIFSFNYV